MKLVLIFLIESFFNSFMKMKNEKRMKALKIQSQNLLNMKKAVICLNLIFYVEVETKSKFKNLNFVFQFMKNTKWHFWVYGFSSILNFANFQLLQFYSENITLQLLQFPLPNRPYLIDIYIKLISKGFIQSSRQSRLV